MARHAKQRPLFPGSKPSVRDGGSSSPSEILEFVRQLREAEVGEDPLSVAARREAADGVLDAVAELSADQQRVLDLGVQRASSDEAGASLGSSPGAYRNRLYRVRAGLADVIEPLLEAMPHARPVPRDAVVGRCPSPRRPRRHRRVGGGSEMSSLANASDATSLADAIYRALGGEVTGFAERFGLADPTVSGEDILGELIVRVLNREFVERADPRAWVFTVVRNLCVDLARRRARRIPTVSLDVDDADAAH